MQKYSGKGRDRHAVPLGAVRAVWQLVLWQKTWDVVDETEVLSEENTERRSSTALIEGLRKIRAFSFALRIILSLKLNPVRGGFHIFLSARGPPPIEF